MKECYIYQSFVLQSATLLKVTLSHGCFSRFVNCGNSTKLRIASQIVIICNLFELSKIALVFILDTKVLKWNMLLRIRSVRL